MLSLVCLLCIPRIRIPHRRVSAFLRPPNFKRNDFRFRPPAHLCWQWHAPSRLLVMMSEREYFSHQRWNDDSGDYKKNVGFLTETIATTTSHSCMSHFRNMQHLRSFFTRPPPTNSKLSTTVDTTERNRQGDSSLTRTISGLRPKGEAGSDSCNATRRGTDGDNHSKEQRRRRGIWS